MSPHNAPQLSKSRFMAGLQCLKRLYLECNQSELADPIGPSQQHLFDTGTAVGELARKRYPRGSLVREQYFDHPRAVDSTDTLLADASIDAVFEPAFTFESIRTRVDILKRSGNREFDLVEVKSSTRVKADHIPDVAIQLHVLEGSGIPVRRAFLMHINNTYVYQGGLLDLEQLFSLQDVTDDARAFASEDIPGALGQMWEVLQRDEVPVVEVGPHCNTPYQCPFYGSCNLQETEHPIEELPRLSQKTIAELRDLGIRDINNIPPDFSSLTPTQRKVRDSVVSGKPSIGPDLASRLGEVRSPATFMDFETFNPAIPIYAGTRPYQVIPFQWSIHIRDETGQLSHESFLNDDADDPRERFIASLLDSVPTEGTILVYSGYEQTMMRQLAESFPQYADRLEGLCARTLDLLKLVRENYYHPEFHGSNSIKSVLPALVPELSYGDLEIQDGSIAAITYAQMIAAGTPRSDTSNTREVLLAYCERDTEAMVRVFDVLVAESIGTRGSF